MRRFSTVIFLFAWLVLLTRGQECRSVRYMPLGDSITDLTCWRAYLWENMQRAGYANVNFVGSSQAEAPSGCDVLSYDKDNEGHSGYLATHIVALGLVPRWLKQNPADLVTIHLGSNDISHGYSTNSILDAFTTIVEQLRESNKRMKIIVAQIIPLHIGEFESVVLELNSQIPLWAAALSSRESPIYVVDQHTGFEREDLRDGVHPNESGDRKMATRWYPAVVDAVQLVLSRQTMRDFHQIPLIS